jgi:elongation factor P--beta-lysine ligase
MDANTVTPFRRRLQGRAQLYALIRAFFAERNVLEVETPILSAAGNTDPNIESFTAPFSGHIDAGARERWLRTSPEHPLKRCLLMVWAIVTSLAAFFAMAKQASGTTPNSPCWSGIALAGATGS